MSWHEADAYARWIGKRLPTEAEWAYAASWDPINKISRVFPWGDSWPTRGLASFGMESCGPQPAGGRSGGASAFDLLDMAGNVWEWTASQFLPYPGFEPFHSRWLLEKAHGWQLLRVPKGWFVVTENAAPILRCSFRNWYVPTYRQGFLGVRCAL